VIKLFIFSLQTEDVLLGEVKEKKTGTW